MKQPFGTATRVDLWFTVASSAVVVVATAVDAVSKVGRIVRNRDVPVEVYVDPQRRPVSIEGVGEAIPAEFDRVTVHVSDLAPASLASAVLAVVVPAVAVIAVMICVAVLCRNLAAGRFFGRTNTRLVVAVSMIIAGGWLVGGLARTMASNGALARLAPGGGEAAITFQFSFTYLFAAIVVGCLAAAFHAGERMQRDSDGLV